VCKANLTVLKQFSCLSVRKKVTLNVSAFNYTRHDRSWRQHGTNPFTTVFKYIYCFCNGYAPQHWTEQCHHISWQCCNQLQVLSTACATGRWELKWSTPSPASRCFSFLIRCTPSKMFTTTSNVARFLSVLRWSITCRMDAQLTLNHVVDLYNKESTMALKKAHKLSSATLDPKSIEKTSVELAVSVFSESTRDALQFYAENEGHFSWAAAFAWSRPV